MNHLVNRNVDEQCRIIRNIVDNAVREAFGKFFHLGLDKFRRFQRIGTRLQIYCKGDAVLSVELGSDAVILRAKFNTRHVFQTKHGAAVVVAFKNDIAELLSIDQTALGVDAVGIRLIFAHRLLAELAGGKLGVLFLYGGYHVLRRQIIVSQLVGAEPDAHRIVLRSKQRSIADASDTFDFIQNIQQRIVRDINRIITVGGRTHGNNLQDGV